MPQSPLKSCRGKLVGSALSILALAVVIPGNGRAEDASKSAATAYAEIQHAMGGVPTFVKLYPKVAVAGAWAQVRDLEYNDSTALSPKVKALISLAVSSQIPCQYCIWLDARTAREKGATQEEISEAVAISGLTRQWSTVFNGLQIDFGTFKKEMGGGMTAHK